MSTKEEQAAFLQVLRANEDDNATRLVYADWLEDHDMLEEADRMRRWQASKEWMLAWAVEHAGYEDDDPQILYKECLEAGQRAVDRHGWTFGRTGASEWFYDEGRAKEWFKHWSILTGVLVVEEVATDPGFRCAC